MDQKTHHFARAFQWLGWDRRVPSTAAVFADDAVSMLVLRDRPLRVTACGTVPLSVGTVRRQDVRLVGLAADALRRLQEFLRVPAESPLTLVVDPHEAEVDPTNDTIIATLDKAQLAALARCAEEAGSTTVGFDAVPASITRLARVIEPARGDPIYAGGAGWLSASMGAVSEISTSGDRSDVVSSGTTPSALLPITQPAPIAVVAGVELAGPWQLLLGAALAGFDQGPAALIETRDHPATIGWAAERIAGVVR